VSNLVTDLWYKVTHRSGGEEAEIHGRYLGVVPSLDDGGDSQHLFAVEGQEEPLQIAESHLVYFEAVPPMLFPR
jgi:hypothetical protein